MPLSRRDILRLLAAGAAFAPLAGLAADRPAKRSPKKGWAGKPSGVRKTVRLHMVVHVDLPRQQHAEL